MRSFRKTLLAATAACLLGTSPAFAEGKSQGGGNHCQGNSCGGLHGIGAPGPIAGAGLPFLLLAGGYMLVRRYRKRKADKE
jgi:hypothetical protein